MSYNPYPWAYPNLPNTSVPIAGQTESTYLNWKKTQEFDNVGWFLDPYVVEGGYVTKNAKQNDRIDISLTEFVLDNALQQRQSIQGIKLKSPNSTYFVDIYQGDYWVDTSHPSGTAGQNYLTLATVTTDAIGNVDVITDSAEPRGGFRLKSQYGLYGYLREIINVRDFGAVGDGVTDDTEKVQQAIDAANAQGKKAIFFSRGIYYVTQLNNEDALYFFGDNAAFVGGYTQKIAQLGESQDIFINVKDNGAKGDGVTDDTQAFISSINIASSMGGGIVFVPPGVYMVTPNIDMKSNVQLVGSGSSTVIRAISGTVLPESHGFIRAETANNFLISSLSIDLTGSTYSGGASGAINIGNSSYFQIDNVSILNFPLVGILGNNVHFGVIRDCTLEYQTAKPTFNQAVLISSSAGASNNITVERTRMVRSALNMSGNSHRLLNNEISNWMYGAGLTFESDAYSYSLLIQGNHIYGGTGTDENSYSCGGIEIWARQSIIVGNNIHDNAGAGIDLGGKRCTVQGNIIKNNNRSGLGAAGISIRYVDGTYNGSFANITGNTIYENAYGIADQTASTSNVTIGPNDMWSNTISMLLIKGTAYSIYTPELQFKSTIDVPSLANGAAYQTNFTAGGVTVGDFLIVTASVNTLGVKIITWVDSANSVSIRFENNTGNTVDLPSATYFVIARKAVTFG